MRWLTGCATLAVVLAGCAGGDNAATDSAADTGAAAVTAGPTMESLAGTWTGQNMAETGDSVTGRFTAIQTADGNGKYIAEGSTDTVAYTFTIDGDSVMNSSSPFTDPDMPAGTGQVMFRTVGRLSGSAYSGTSSVMLASKPDSVIARGRWTATKNP